MRASFVRNLAENKNKTIKYGLCHYADNVIYVSEEFIVEAKETFISIFTDITDTHKTNIELNEIRERLELVLAGTRLGMWDWNPQTNDVVFDERWAEMLGLKMSDLTQTLSDWQDRVHPEDIDDCFADITAHIEGKLGFMRTLTE